jgi:hypothetical protein
MMVIGRTRWASPIGHFVGSTDAIEFWPTTGDEDLVLYVSETPGGKRFPSAA